MIVCIEKRKTKTIVSLHCLIRDGNKKIQTKDHQVKLFFRIYTKKDSSILAIITYRQKKKRIKIFVILKE